MRPAPSLLPDRLADPDGFYASLMQAHDGLDTAASHALNARLVLLMANEIGDADRLAALLAIARAAETGDG